METNYPPCTITDKMLNYVSDIMKKIEATDNNKNSPNKKYKLTD